MRPFRIVLGEAFMLGLAGGGLGLVLGSLSISALQSAPMLGSVLTFCGLWGVPYLTTHYGFSTAQAASLTSLLMICWAAASPVFGWLSDRLGRRKPLMILGQIKAGLGWAFILFAPRLSPALLTILTAATGLCSASFIICWSLAKESVPVHLAGTISGVINMGIMLGATVLQPAVGWMLDRRWEGHTQLFDALGCCVHGTLCGIFP